MNEAAAAIIGVWLALPYPAAAGEPYLALVAGTFALGNTSTLNSQFICDRDPAWSYTE